MRPYGTVKHNKRGNKWKIYVQYLCGEFGINIIYLCHDLHLDDLYCAEITGNHKL